MYKKTYYWHLQDFSGANSLERYCHNCGRKVVFRDSKQRRRNANGKTIYEYAIYKCEKQHTWNLLMGIYKSTKTMEHHKTNDNVQEVSNHEFINLLELKNEGIKEIEIILEEVTGKWRIDKLLGERIRDISRNKVCELISLEKVLLNGKPVKQNYLLKKQQKITVVI